MGEFAHRNLPSGIQIPGIKMADVDKSDPDLKYLVVNRNAFNDPTTQAEWTQKKLVWVPHESQGFVAASIKAHRGDEVEVELVDTSKLLTELEAMANNLNEAENKASISTRN